MSNSKKIDLNAIKERSHMIIAAIDSLKGRKARPDELKICNFVQRRFGIKKEDIIKGINQAVKDGSVLKVKYKDSVSYRNPAKFSHKMQNHIMYISGKCSPQTMKRVLRELRVLSRTALNGVSKQNIVDSLHYSSQYMNYNEELVEKVIKRAIETGSVKQLPNGNYTLSCGKRIVPRKGDPDQTASSSKLFSDSFYPAFDNNGNKIDNKDKVMFDECSDKALNKTDDEVNEESSTVSNGTSIASVSVTRKKSTPVMKRARPVSKRKKFKKSLGPDFIESSELGLQYMRDSFEPKCDFCHLRIKSNKRGQKEELLNCKDCSAKAHPSCMDYSEELAERSSRSPWQCMECKTCNLCNDSRDGINMLVCDMCDKGYHMSCHIPPVKEKPIGKWACSECTLNKSEDNFTDDVNVKSDEERIVVEEKYEPMDDFPLKQTLEKVIDERQSDTSSLSSLASNSKENLLNGYPKVIPNPRQWSAEDVENFIRNIGFPEQSILFKEQEIDGSCLLLLRRTDVLTGFEMKLGPALKIYSHIMRLQNINNE